MRIRPAILAAAVLTGLGVSGRSAAFTMGRRQCAGETFWRASEAKPKGPIGQAVGRGVELASSASAQARLGAVLRALLGR